jgi:hypothetical protein
MNPNIQEDQSRNAIQPNSLLAKWRDDGLADDLKKLMSSKVFKRALEIIEEHTEPNDLVVQRAYRESPQFADQIIASLHKMQAGERRVLRMLKFLSEMSQETKLGQLPPPFEHITHKYFEERQ